MYALRVTPQAEEDLTHLMQADRQLAHPIVAKLETLEDRPYQGKALVGPHAGRRSLRIGTYRINYRIEESSQTVFILTAQHRRHVY